MSNWTLLVVVRFGLKNGHQNDMCLIDNGLHGHNLLTIRGSIGSQNDWGTWWINKDENIWFDDEWEIYNSIKKNGYAIDFDILIILYQSHFPYPKRIKCML